MTDHLFTDREQLSQDCLTCGKPFSFPKPERGRYPVCCSEICRKQRHLQQMRGWEPPLERRQRAPRTYPVRAERPIRYCHWCLEPHTRGGKAVFCSDDCQHRMSLCVRRTKGYTRGQHGLVTKDCRACGAQFECRTDNDRYICSDECRAAWIRIKGPRPSFIRFRASKGVWTLPNFDQLFEGHDFDAGKVRRVKQRLQTIEKVDSLVVLDRDGWICQICGKPTPKSLRGTGHADAPEVDHIIPIARGGEHSYANTQCACRQCNRGKSAKLEYKPMISMR